MQPRIQYARTADGVSIVYWTLGEGDAAGSHPVPIWGVAISGVSIDDYSAMLWSLATYGVWLYLTWP